METFKVVFLPWRFLYIVKFITGKVYVTNVIFIKYDINHFNKLY